MRKERPTMAGYDVCTEIGALPTVMHSTDIDIDAPIPYRLAPLAPCPNGKSDDGCWYCLQRRT
jgi:hypothetical protein